MAQKDRIEREVVLNAPRQMVWDAITKADLVSQWFGTDTKIPSLTVGQEIVFEWADYDGVTRAIIEEVEPMTVFAYRWEHGDVDLNKPIVEDVLTLVTFTLEDAGAGTRLTVVETGFASLPEGVGSYEENSGGWTSELKDLQEYLHKETV